MDTGVHSHKAIPPFIPKARSLHKPQVAMVVLLEELLDQGKWCSKGTMPTLDMATVMVVSKTAKVQLFLLLISQRMVHHLLCQEMQEALMLQNQTMDMALAHKV